MFLRAAMISDSESSWSLVSVTAVEVLAGLLTGEPSAAAVADYRVWRDLKKRRESYHDRWVDGEET